MTARGQKARIVVRRRFEMNAMGECRVG